jgi:hypothetical protein
VTRWATIEKIELIKICPNYIGAINITLAGVAIKILRVKKFTIFAIFGEYWTISQKLSGHTDRHEKTTGRKKCNVNIHKKKFARLEIGSCAEQIQMHRTIHSLTSCFV